MQPISPHYRNDSSEGLDDELRQYLDENYAAKLKNIRRDNPKLLVVFSGGNAVGKSTISRLIEEQLGGLVLENDEIKRTILKYKPDCDRDELNKLTWQYSTYLYRHLQKFTTNGLIVRDGVIDWYYDRILPIFEAKNYPLFIIGFDLSREKLTELIKSRGDTPTVKEERFYTLLEDHAIHMKRFRDKFSPDIMLNDTTVFNHKMVIDRLRQRIDEL